MGKFFSFFDTDNCEIHVDVTSSTSILITCNRRSFINSSISSCIATLRQILYDFDSSQIMNISNACNYLDVNVMTEKSTGCCAEKVREAFNAGGLYYGKIDEAFKYHTENVLLNLGFHKIQEPTLPLPGDVSVQTYKPHGHICMYIGNGTWISDFRQNTPRGHVDEAFFYRLPKSIIINIKNLRPEDSLCEQYKNKLKGMLSLTCSGSQNTITVRTTMY